MRPLLDEAKRANNKETVIALRAKIATWFRDYLELSAQKQAALDTEAQILLHYNQTESALELAETEKLHPGLLLQIAEANNKRPDRARHRCGAIAA